MSALLQRHGFAPSLRDEPRDFGRVQLAGFGFGGTWHGRLCALARIRLLPAVFGLFHGESSRMRE
jgi:hypothetical protein